jgi:hypothetical protein
MVPDVNRKAFEGTKDVRSMPLPLKRKGATVW